MSVVVRTIVLAVTLVALGAWYAFDAPPPDLAPSQEVLDGDVADDASIPAFEDTAVASASSQQAPVPPSGPTLLYDSVLSAEGIFALTNVERRETGLGALTQNSALSNAALEKARDILARGYFDHIAPDGTRPADLAERAGYRYILVGENLALGEFGSNEEVVAGWMESTEHRENILHERYRDIGVAVAPGVFEGAEVWVAVQTFGLPRSACPEVPAGLYDALGRYTTELNRLRGDLALRYESLRALPRSSNQYREEISAYNSAAEAFNTLVANVEDLTERFNESVRALNACIEEA